MQYSETESIGTKPPHEYIRDILPFRYQECISCGNRTDLICIRCGYCYSCHWKKEQVEEFELRDNLKDFYLSLSNNNSNMTVIGGRIICGLATHRQISIDWDCFASFWRCYVYTYRLIL
jgi:hypothetical protein